MKKTTDNPTGNIMINEIKELRLEVDKLINSVQVLNPSREMSLCFTQLQRSKSWLGMALGELGSETPYPASSDPKSPVIEPQAEHCVDSIFDPSHIPQDFVFTQTTCVKLFRQRTDEYMEKFDKFYLNFQKMEGYKPMPL